MSDRRYRITIAQLDNITGEYSLYCVHFANCEKALQFAFAHGTEFVSYRDRVSNITIYDIDELTAYNENMQI